MQEHPGGVSVCESQCFLPQSWLYFHGTYNSHFTGNDSNHLADASWTETKGEEIAWSLLHRLARTHIITHMCTKGRTQSCVPTHKHTRAHRDTCTYTHCWVLCHTDMCNKDLTTATGSNHAVKPAAIRSMAAGVSGSLAFMTDLLGSGYCKRILRW